MFLCMCVCEKKRERERERGGHIQWNEISQYFEDYCVHVYKENKLDITTYQISWLNCLHELLMLDSRWRWWQYPVEDKYPR